MSNLTVEKLGAEHTLIFHSAIDANTVPVFEIESVQAVQGAGKLYLDMRGVDYMDSTGLGFLISLKSKAEKQNIPLALKNTPEHVMQLLTLTRLRDAFAFA